MLKTLFDLSLGTAHFRPPSVIKVKSKIDCAAAAAAANETFFQPSNLIVMANRMSVAYR